MGKERRDYPEICRAVLKALDKPKTVNEVALKVKAGWITVVTALRFLESIGYAEKIVDKPLIYKRRQMLAVQDEFIKDMSLIIKRRGSRHSSLEDCLGEALRDFIRKEKGIKRY
jgi:hypothetical protein